MIRAAFIKGTSRSALHTRNILRVQVLKSLDRQRPIRYRSIPFPVNPVDEQ